MARGNGNAGAVAVKVTPPKVQRGRATTTYPEGFIASVVEVIQGREETGEPFHASDGNTYTADGTGDKAKDKAKDKANTAVMRLKKALVNDPSTPYTEPRDIRSRVWEDSEGVFRFSIYERVSEETAEEGS